MRILANLSLIVMVTMFFSFDAYSMDLGDSKNKNQKISSALSYAIDDVESEAESASTSSLMTTARDVDDEGNIRVYIMLNEFSKENLEKLEERGVVVEIYDESQNLVQGTVATSKIETISNLEIVKFVDLPNVGFTNAGSVQTEGDPVVRGDEARAEFGVDGTGIHVAVVSDGINGLTQSVASGDIPAAGIMVPSSPLAEGGVGVNDPCPPFMPVTSTPVGREDITTGAEGLAMLEIIVDIAPGAILYFAGGLGGITTLEFQRAKKCLSEMVDIIADDIGFFNAGSYDGSSPVSLQSTASVQDGVANFISVGNQAQVHYQGTFTDTDGDGFHEFDVSLGMPYKNNSGETLNITIPPFIGGVSILLQWNDPFSSLSSNDYDMAAIQPSDPADLSSPVGIVGASGLIQDGASFPPIERIDLPFNDTGVPQTVGIVILDFLKVNGLGSAEPREFDLFVLGIPGLDEFRVPQSSVPNNSDADLVCSVGSVGLGAGDPLGQFSNEIRSYSSRGPTNDGRLKPDIVAPDGVSITGNGGFPVPFFGTSAAAPHAAGVAALVLEADNSLSPAALTSSLIATRALSPSQLAGVLNSTAVDLGAPGPDNTFGFGRIDAFAAVQAVVAAGPSPSPSPTATPGPTASPGPPTTAPPTNPPGDGMTTSNGGCSVAGSVTATTAVVNILMSILVLIGFGLVMRLRSVIR